MRLLPLAPILFVLTQTVLTVAPSEVHAAPRMSVAPARAPSRATRDEALARAFGASFGGSFRATRQGDVVVLEADPKVPRSRAYPMDNTRLFRAVLRAEAETLGGDPGDDFRVHGYFGDPPPEPTYLEAAQRLGATETASARPLVRAWFDDAGHLVRVQIVGEAMRGVSRLPRSPRYDDATASVCALRGSVAKPEGLKVTLVVARRHDGTPYLAWNVRALPGAGVFDADVDALTCAVVVHEDKR